tara:strand:+ start:311 stop:490 length:180 start_codon:yes stop_codon:yes gene_type:complete
MVTISKGKSLKIQKLQKIQKVRSADTQKQGLADQYPKEKGMCQVLKHNSLDWLAKNYVW